MDCVSLLVAKTCRQGSEIMSPRRVSCERKNSNSNNNGSSRALTKLVDGRNRRTEGIATLSVLVTSTCNKLAVLVLLVVTNSRREEVVVAVEMQ